MYRPNKLVNNLETDLTSCQDTYVELIDEYYAVSTEPLIENSFENHPGYMALLSNIHTLLHPSRRNELDAWTSAYQAFHFAVNTARIAGMNPQVIKIGDYFSTVIRDGAAESQEAIVDDINEFYTLNPNTHEFVSSYLTSIGEDADYIPEIYNFAALGFILMEASCAPSDIPGEIS